MTDDEWIGADEAAIILRVSSRMVYRYAEGDAPKIRRTTAGRRVLFHHADVIAYAEEINADDKPEPIKDVIRADEAIQLLREAQQRAEVYARRIGDLEGQLRMLPPPEMTETLKQQVATLERERDRLQEERDRLQAQLQRPWWRRLLGS